MVVLSTEFYSEADEVVIGSYCNGQLNTHNISHKARSKEKRLGGRDTHGHTHAHTDTHARTHVPLTQAHASTYMHKKADGENLALSIKTKPPQKQ